MTIQEPDKAIKKESEYLQEAEAFSKAYERYAEACVNHTRTPSQAIAMMASTINFLENAFITALNKAAKATYMGDK